MVEAGERAVDAGHGAAEAREHAGGCSPRAAHGVPGSQLSTRASRPVPDRSSRLVQARHGCVAGEQRERGVLEIEQLRIGPGRVQLQHVPPGGALEREVEVDLAGQRRRARLDAEVLARDPLRVGGHRAHVTRPGVASKAS